MPRMSMPDPWAGLRPGERPYRGAAWFYAEYRDRPSAAFAERLARELGWTPSDRILDLGAGPAQVSVVLAPFVGEVVAMDPEPDMLEEGRRRAAAAGVDNVTFVLGGSDDLPAAGSELGPLTGATISHAFHWMAGQDEVLRGLGELLDAERGAVAIVGFVTGSGPGAAWLERPPWNAVAEIRDRYVAGTPSGPHPRGRHDPFPDLLSRSAFSDVELITHEQDAVVKPSIDAAIGFQYTLSNVLARLGDRRAAFEADARAALAGADTSPLVVRVTESALVGRRP